MFDQQFAGPVGQLGVLDDILDELVGRSSPRLRGVVGEPVTHIGLGNLSEIRVFSEQLADHRVDVDHLGKLLRDPRGKRVVAGRLDMLGQHVRGRQKFLGGAVGL